MKRRVVLSLLLGALPLLLAASAPSVKMFNGQVTSLESGGLSPLERAAAAGRQWASEKPGSVFFTAWAFPAIERIHSGHWRHDGDENGPIAVRCRDRRIVMRTDEEQSLNISGGAGAKGSGVSWGVFLFLNQVENGRCRVLDMHVLAPDRIYELGGERLAWLGLADEKQGLEFIRTLLVPGSDRNLRKESVFAIYLLRGAGAVADLIGLARRDPDLDVRKDAIFWLGQKASVAAIAALGDVIASPEDLEIKKAAVFALSQLPEEKGTPMLLGIARQHSHPRVRKEAIFWLGQSGDPRALDFFEEILLK